MIVPREGEQRVRPSPSTRLPPRRRNVDYYRRDFNFYRHDFDYDDSDFTSWHARVPYLNREAVTIKGETSGFYKAPPSPHATSDQGSNDLNVPQGSRATTPVAPVSIPEDELRMLQGYKTIFVVDDSMWMYGGGSWKRVCACLSVTISYVDTDYHTFVAGSPSTISAGRLGRPVRRERYRHLLPQQQVLGRRP